MNFVNLTIMLTITVAGILLVKKLLGMKITPRGHMLLWLLIAVQILAWPVSEWLPEADWAVRQYVPQVTDGRTFSQDIPPHIDDGIPMNETVVQENTISITSPVTGVEMNHNILTTRVKAERRNIIISAVWGTGSLLMLLILAAGAGKQKRKLKELPICQNGELLHTFSDVKKRMGLETRSIPLKTGADTTMLAGVFCPEVYLAAGSDFTEEELRHVFAHELTHYKHRDLWLNVLRAGMLCAFWWNPVFWLAFRRFHMDMEVYCDYDAAKVTGDRKAYAHTLVKAAAGKKRFMLATTSLANEEHQVSRRVKALAKFKQPKIWVSVLAVCVLLGVGAGLVVNPDSEKIITEEIKEGQLINGDTRAMVSPEELKELVKIINRAEMEEISWTAGDPVYEAYKDTVRGPQCGIIQLTKKDRWFEYYELEFYRFTAEESYVSLQLNNTEGRMQHWLTNDEKLVELVGEIWSKRFPEVDVTQLPEPEKLGIYDEFQQLLIFDTSGAGPAELQRKDSWVYGDAVHVKKNSGYPGDELLQMLLYSEETVRTELTEQKVARRLLNLWWDFDYWQEWSFAANSYTLLIGHDRSDPDGEGDVYVIQFGEDMRGWRVDLPEAAYLLADAVKLQFKSESENHDWRICDGDKSWEEAVELFETQYGQRYSEEELAFLQARNEGTYMEATLPKTRVIEVQEVSELENAVRIYWVEEKTYFNDVSERADVWAGGGFEYTENPDGSLTMRRSYINHLYNDGEGWYHVNNGFDPNTKMNLNEDGSLKEGLIRY